MIIKPLDRIDQFKLIRSGERNKKGLSTGYHEMDDNIKLAKGYLSIITGYPSSGKSEFLDAILTNMAIAHKWRVLYYSPENHPVEGHMSKLAEKYVGKPITEFSDKAIKSSLEFLDHHFTWMYPENPELDTLLALAEETYKKDGLDCLVIDPWNAVTHHRTGMLHEYLSEALSKVIRFARDNDVLVCVVAHPTKPQKDKDGSIPVPTLYDISDGAMWRNKADYGIIVHRPDMSKNAIDVYIQKIKFKWMGQVGSQSFDYDYRSGRFKHVSQTQYLLPGEEQQAF